MTLTQKFNNGLGTKEKDNLRTTRVQYKNWQRTKTSYVQGARNLYSMEKSTYPTILFPNLKGVKTHTKTYNSSIFCATNKFITVDFVICLSRVLGKLACSVLRGFGNSNVPALPDFILKPGECADKLLLEIEEFLAQK